MVSAYNNILHEPMPKLIHDMAHKFLNIANLHLFNVINKKNFFFYYTSKSLIFYRVIYKKKK